MKHDACGLCPICDRVCRHQRPCICDGRNETVDPFCVPPPRLDYDASLPKLDPSWKGWSLWRGETWFDGEDWTPMMFRWTDKGVALIMEGETFGEDDLILVPPNQLCGCWFQRPCKAHREPPVAIEEVPK